MVPSGYEIKRLAINFLWQERNGLRTISNITLPSSGYTITEIGAVIDSSEEFYQKLIKQVQGKSFKCQLPPATPRPQVRVLPVRQRPTNVEACRKLATPLEKLLPRSVRLPNTRFAIPIVSEDAPTRWYQRDPACVATKEHGVLKCTLDVKGATYEYYVSSLHHFSTTSPISRLEQY